MSAVLILAAVPAFAQSVAPAGSPKPVPRKAAKTNVEEVVVTAQRRSQRLQDVAASVTAISAAQLSRAGITNTSDIAKVTTAVVLPLNGAFLQPAIRGVSSTGANVGDNANVALYVDGVYQPQQIASLIDLPDVQDIEVLKGPQGALYGQNATGGAILVTTAAPSFKPGGFATLSYGNYHDVKLTGTVTGPLTSNVAGSLSGGFEDHGGFRTSIINGEHDKGLDSKVIRGKLLYKPVDNLELLASGYYTNRVDSDTYAGVAIAGNSIGNALGSPVPANPNPSQFDTTPDVFARTISYGFALNGKLTLDAGTVSTITAYSHNKTNYLADVDFSPVNFATASAGLSAHYFEQEANFTSNKFGRFTFLAGAFYLNGVETFNPSQFTLYVPDTFAPAPPGDIELILPEYGRINKQIEAGYAEVTADVTKRLILTVDGRFTSETQRAYNNQNASGLYNGALMEYPGGAVTFNKFTPRVTLRYKLNDESNIYGSWGEGFKSGIINTANFDQAPVKPETISAFEVGYKGLVFPTVRFNVAGFYYDYSDLQVVAYAPPQFIQQNAASARIKGIDGDVNWKVTPEFTLAGGAAYLDAQYLRFPNAEIFIPDGFGSTTTTGDLSGHTLLRSPRWTSNFSANYSLDTELGTFNAYVAGAYTSAFSFEPTGRISQSAYATMDTQLSFEPTALPHLRLVVYGRNLTNKAYLDDVLVSNFADGGAYADPRTYGVRAEYRF